MNGSGYESWFVSARDPVAPRALWIRHTRHQPRQGTESAALWCTVVDHDLSPRPLVVKQVAAAFPPDAAAGPGQFRGEAAMGARIARWDLAVAGGKPLLRPLHPSVLYRTPLPRTKLEVPVPDGQVTGVLDVEGHAVDVSRWRGTVGHNWGSEHADCWVWLHAADFGGAPDAWLELVLARIKAGPARLPWTAMGALSLNGQLIVLGGLGRRTQVEAAPGQLTASVPAPQARLDLRVTTQAGHAVVVPYSDPQGGTRTVSHAALAQVELTLHRRGERELSLSSDRAAYEYGTSQPMPGPAPEPLPGG